MLFYKWYIVVLLCNGLTCIVPGTAWYLVIVLGYTWYRLVYHIYFCCIYLMHLVLIEYDIYKKHEA